MQTNHKISDELLAAFIDGSTTQEQNEYILEAFKENPEQYEEFKMAYLGANILNEEFTDTERSKNEFGIVSIPAIILGGGMATGTIIGNLFEHSHIPMVAANNDENNLLNDRFNNHHDSLSVNDNNHHMETTIYEAPNQFGEEANNYVSPNVDQGYSDTCAVRSQQLVLNDFGIPVTQEDLMKEATQYGWYSQGEGTPLEFVGNLLENHGVAVNRFENANIYNLTNELAQGHKVIIGVDANELWHNGFVQDAKDLIIGESANHALIVAGIDTSDPNHVQVILEDPGTGDVAKTYPLEQFMDAWKDSHHYMVSTQEPAPLAFNQETMMGFNYDIGHIENADTLLNSLQEITDYDPISYDYDSIHLDHDPVYSDCDLVDNGHDPHQPDSEIYDHHSDNDHHDDLDILNFENNI